MRQVSADKTGLEEKAKALGPWLRLMERFLHRDDPITLRMQRIAQDPRTPRDDAMLSFYGAKFAAQDAIEKAKGKPTLGARFDSGGTVNDVA